MNLEVIVQNLFKENHCTLSLAESCSGGNLSAKLVNLSGASEFFLGSLVAYSNAAKAKLLGVSEEKILSFGAVSAEVALDMAYGAKKIFSSDISLATTGIAGPNGGSIEKPIGTVFIALILKNNQSFFWKYQFQGNRAQIIEATVRESLSILSKISFNS